MKTSERTGRFLCTAAAIGVALFLLPIWGIRADVVLSGSMEPALKTGSIVFTDTGRTLPEIGDIITYRLGNSYVTHRVIRKTEEGFVTKGDANGAEDSAYVRESQIEGLVIFSVPVLGYAVLAFQRKPIFCLLFLMLVQEIVFLTIPRKGERFR